MDGGFVILESTNHYRGKDMTLMRAGLLTSIVLLGLQLSMAVQAKEFNVDCSSFEDCMNKGDQLAKKRKLSLSQEAYRNAIKFDVNSSDAWRKFEKMTVRISEEGGC